MRPGRSLIFCAILAALASHRPAAAGLPAGQEFTNSVGMKLVRIEPGEFLMGCGEEPPRDEPQWKVRDWDESPAHRVRISKAFYLGACEVTNAQFERFDPGHRRFRARPDAPGSDDEPASRVTWQQAVNYCRWLSQQEGRPYRLPTEAEWEYACRAGTTTDFHTGGRLSAEQANFGVARDGKRQIAALGVGTFPPNAWGLYDVHGNVAEWCLDWYGPYEAALQTDPVGRADGCARVARGWSFLPVTHPGGAARYCRSANRAGHLPDDANRATGFRVAMGEAPSGKPLPVPLLPCQRDVRQAAAPARTAEADKPYFIDYGKDRKNPAIPKDSWGPVFSHWNHYSTVCVCPNGDVLAAWYTTVQEEGRELAQAASRLRAGADRWDEASLFFDVPDVNDHAPVLFCDGRRVFHFSTQSLRAWDDAAVMMRVSDDSGATWSKPRIILARDDPDHLSQPCSAVRTSDGALALACDGDGHEVERLLRSRDGGRTWQVAKGDLRKAARGRYVIHPAVVQRRDGSLLSFMRGPDPMPAFLSKDLGDSWQEQSTPFPGVTVGQKPAALRLASGAIVLASIDNSKRLVGGGTFAAMSLDEGRTWPHVRKVEGPSGYMSLAQARDGTIYLFGPDSSRPACAAFNEAWLREGNR